MAKKDTVFIDIQTSDGGSMQRVAVSAKKLGLALDDAGKASAKTGKSSRDADRNLKGLSQQSANSTKNFSKMAQGMTGTLVPAYAILASNVFAITAAFQFLKQAADFRVMQDSQVAFTAATGVGMQSLTKNIQEASGMMLEFQAASEAASIGIASGLGSGQIEELAAGAGNLSKILGRDVTDSFNRLIRGVTKAEPELLDELGITLRLADAQENYAASLNKSAKDLTNFEKKQAVFAEVQDQLETKYGKVAKATDVQVNAVSRLGVEFDRIMKGIKAFTAAIAEPTAKFLTENLVGLGIALAALAVPIIKAIIPGLDNWAEKSKESADEAGRAYQAAQQDIEDLAKQQEKLEKSLGGKGAAKAAGKAKKGSGLDMLQSGNEETLKKDKRRIAQMLRHAEAGNGAIKNMNKRQAKDYIATLKGMQRGHNTFTEKVGMNFRRMTAGASLSMKKMKAQWTATMASMKGAAARFSGGVDKIFRAAGWIGALILAGELAKGFAKSLGFFGENDSLKNLAENFGDIAERLETVNKEYKDFSEVQRKLAESGGTATDALIAQGTFFSTVSTNIVAATQAVRDYEDKTTSAQKQQELLAKSAEKRQAEIARLDAIDKRENYSFTSVIPGAAEAANAALNVFQEDGMEKADREKLTRLRKEEQQYQDYTDTLELTDVALAKLNASILTNTSVVFEHLKSMSDRTDVQEKYFQGLVSIREAAEEGKPVAQQTINDVEALGKRYDEQARRATHLKTQEKELQKQYTQAINGITKYSTSVSSLQSLLEDQIQAQLNLQKITTGDTKFKEESDKKIEGYKKQLTLLSLIADEEIRIANARIKDQTIFNAALQGATKLQKEQLTLAKKRLDNIRQLQVLNVDILKARELATDVGEERAKQLEFEVDRIVRQNELLKEQEELMFQIMASGKQAFETGMQSAISKLLKGEESSLKDALLGIGKGVVDSMIDAFSKKATGKLMNLFGMETEEQLLAKAIADGHDAGARKLKTVHEAGAAQFKTVFEDFNTKFAEIVSQITNKPPPDTTSAGTVTTESGALTPDQIRSGMANSGTYASSYAADGTGQGTAGTIVTLSEDTLAKLGAETSTGVPAGDTNPMAGALQGTMKGSLGGFHGQEGMGGGTLEDGEGEGGGLKDVMGKLTGETAKMVAGLGLAVTTLLGNSKAAQAVQKIMAVMTIITQSQAIFDKIKLIKDKIMGVKKIASEVALGLQIDALTVAVTANTLAQAVPGKTGIIPGYASGGVARGPRSGYPAVLHGNEAVVPLPDGRSIPVSMPAGQGGGGVQTNNVGVTVNMDRQGNATTETEGDNQDLEQLGERLSELIQEELQNQKRNGGILSPYGVA